MPEFKNELEHLRAELEKKDAEFQALKAELREINKEAEEERHAMMYMLEDANESIAEMEESNKKLRDEMEINTHLLMISEAVANTTDMDRMMEQVIECGRKITGCDICLSYIYDNDREEFIPSQSMGLSSAMVAGFRTTPLKIKLVLIVEAFANRSPAISADKIEISEIEEKFQWINDINTVGVIPLFSREKELGMIIAIYNTKKPDITERTKKVMLGIAHQVSTALEQARLYKETTNKSMELSHKIETIQVMHEIDRSILSTLKSREILETVTMMITRLISCERATVVLVDEEKQGFIYVAGFGVGFISKGGLTLFKDTNTTDVIKTGMSQYISNLREVKNLLPLEDKLLGEGFLSHIRVPLTVRHKIIGALNIGSKRSSAFTSNDLKILEYIASQIGVALENARLISDLEELFIGTVKSLSSAIDAKSKWTAGHSERVTKYAVEIGKGIGLSEKELKDLELSGLLHDIGKIGTYESILDKPGKLTDEEFNLIKQHPLKGAEMILPIKQLREIIPGVKHHHEYYNGRGYPSGLKGEEIPLMARIMCVADSVDAMGADRPYRKGRPMDEIIAEVKRCSGTQFDPKVCEVFLSIGILPEGVFK